MGADDMLSKVKTEILAILIPGTFVTGVILSDVLTYTQDTSTNCVLERFSPFFEVLRSNWILIFLVFVFIFLIGNLIRTIRVNRVDKMGDILFKRFIKDSWTKDLYHESFPYPKMLEKIKEELVQARLVEDFPLPKDKRGLHDLYNYWKTMICIDAPASFAFTQDLESRVRMFAGMFWAGVAGIVGSFLAIISFSFNQAAYTVWGVYILVMLGLSVTLMLAFGLNLKRVRGQEVSSVFLAFLYIQKKNKDTENKEKAQEKTKEKGNLLGPLLNMFKNPPKE